MAGGSNLEPRKIIRFGNSSFVISLPKGWLQKNSLDKGDSVYLDDLGDGSLVLNTGTIKKKKPVGYSISFPSNIKFNERIRREIYHAYLNDFKIIKITGPGVEKNTSDIRQFLHNFAGLEIFKQTSNSIVAHDLLDVEELSLRKMVRRIDVICRSMIEDTIVGIDKKDDYIQIYRRDKDVNRLVFLCFKIIKKASNDVSFSKRMNVTLSDLMDYKIIIDNLEIIADQFKRISKLFFKSKINKTDRKLLKELYSDVEGEYLNVMKAYYNKNRNLAHKVLNSSIKILSRCDSLLLEVSSPKTIIVLEKLKRTQVSIRKIGRIILGLT